VSSGVRVWRIPERRMIPERHVEEGEALVPGVLHLPDALLKGDGELHRGGAGSDRWQ
jgi:hypothetical protein